MYPSSAGVHFQANSNLKRMDTVLAVTAGTVTLQPVFKRKMTEPLGANMARNSL